MSAIAEANIRLYNQPGMIAAYSGTHLMPQEKAILKYTTPGKTLDLGCGTGRATASLTEMGYTVIGLDISEAMIREARRLHPCGTYLLGDACDLTRFSDGEFDIVLFTCGGLDLLHPLSMRIKCLRESHRVLKNHGYFIYATHNKAWVESHPEKNTAIGGGYYRNNGPVGVEVVYATHINEQVKQLRAVGLRMLRCYTGDILNYYMAEKTDQVGKVKVVKPTPKLLTLPARAIKRLKRRLRLTRRWTIAIDLTQPLEALWRNVKKTRRAEINKGMEEIQVIVDPPDKREYIAFEAIHSRSINLFPLPAEWLQDCHLFLARDADNRITAALLTHTRGKSLILRRDSSYRDSAKYHAALTWYAVKWAKEHGYSEFDQGGYNEEKHPAVSFWKSRFGGAPCIRRVP